ncbi:hypothetical protein E8E12_005789 [Didymella heteroderae]|uniref:Wax synthase domain-containing protein n=1 Tax=Didymella heteroderae TaxID=1769908 RepID=A0A9P4WJN4_9PLEO|nr:hypothetical protein E8E12_005789 [Didymella heteroderae]
MATVHAWSELGGNDVISTDSLYMTLFLYFFKDPRRDFRHVLRSDRSEGLGGPDLSPRNDHKKDEDASQSKPAPLEVYAKTFTGRLRWAMMIPQSRPLHDWIIGEPGHDRRVLKPFRHPSRLDFMIDTLSRLLPVLLIFLPLSKLLAAHDPYFSDPAWSIFRPYGVDRSSEGHIAAVLKNLVPAFILRPMAMAMYTYSLLLMLFLPPMLFVLLLNALCLIPNKWSPHTWRPHFGPFSAIARYGMRGLWGRWWHQQMRHIVAEPGRWVAAKAGLRTDGWQKTVKYMLVCVSAFTLSGITHSGMVPPKPRWATISAIELRLSLAGFFWIQPVGIVIELFLLEPTLRRLPTSKRTLQEVLRVVWTVTFMCFSCTFLVLPFGQLGYWSIVPSEYVSHLYDVASLKRPLYD